MAVDSDTDTDSDPARDYIRRMFPFADKLDPSVHAYEELYLQPRSEPKAEAKPPPEQPKPPEKKPIDLPEPNWQQLYPVHQQANLTPMPQPAQFGLDSRQQAASGFEVFKNPLIWIGILGSLLTRRPALAAMTFAGSAMKGYDEGKHDIFKENKEKFDEAVKQVEAQNRIETERYKELWTT